MRDDQTRIANANISSTFHLLSCIHQSSNSSRLYLSQLLQAQNLSDLAERTALRQCESLRSEAEIAKWLEAHNGSTFLCVIAFTAEWYATLLLMPFTASTVKHNSWLESNFYPQFDLFHSGARRVSNSNPHLAFFPTNMPRAAAALVVWTSTQCLPLHAHTVSPRCQLLYCCVEQKQGLILSSASA